MERKSLNLFCLFHQKTDCSCFNPVTDKETLIKRLNQEINFDLFLNGKELNADAKHLRETEILLMRMRLKDLML